jgi:hypothetical protein
MNDPNDLLERLWRTLLADDAIVIDGWRGIVVTGVVAQSSAALSGFACRDDGDAEAIAPQSTAALKLLRDLNDTPILNTRMASAGPSCRRLMTIASQNFARA